MRLVLLSFLTLCASAQAAQKMEITLERRDGAVWKAVDPATILAEGAHVRFRFKSSFNGYLYVTNQGTSGEYTQLFPSQDAGQQNRVEAGKEYMIPSASGSFAVTGPAGQDIVYWMVSPTPLTENPKKYTPIAAAPPPGSNLESLRPRCDDTIFKARGDCIDATAGPKSVRAAQMPEALGDQAGTRSRELIFVKEKNKAVVSTPTALSGPVIYEFRLSHK